MRAYLFVVLAACGSTAHDGGGVTPDASSTTRPDAARDAPATSSGDDPVKDGTSTVATSTTTLTGATADRKLPATIYTPTPANGAAVIISPGFQMKRTQYASYSQHMATHGYTVILTDYADQGLFADHQKLANDVGAVVTYALALPGITNIALAGHSLGGDISTLAASGDPRVKAIVGWDPVDAANTSVVPEKPITAALAVLGETTDGSGGFMPCAPTADNFQQFYAAAPSPALQMTINNADHMDWVDDGTCALCTLCTAGTADPSLAHDATKRLNVAWLNARLLGDTTMQTWLMSPPEVGAGTASVVAK
ncbi:MAG TPA: alpha/beta hydrolase [Kofleriaceae bacterium]